MYYVVYDVEGFGTQQAGPWGYCEAIMQSRDIEGYTGVSNVKIVAAEEVL